MGDVLTDGVCFDTSLANGMKDGRVDDLPFSAKVSVGYPRNDGRRSKPLAPRRSRLCSRRKPSRPCMRRDAGARDWSSALLRCRRDRQWVGARAAR
jgi:hypothetical protein